MLDCHKVYQAQKEYYYPYAHCTKQWDSNYNARRESISNTTRFFPSAYILESEIWTQAMNSSFIYQKKQSY